jgi:methylphosphonate synthase
MNDKTNSQYLKTIGNRILSQANDLKRTPDALAKEIGIDKEQLTSIINGDSNMEQALGVIDKMVNTYPISIKELLSVPDDTHNGVKKVDSETSILTSRVFNRPDSTGGLTPYYEYRDTAMSCTAPFKPEWISQIRYVDNNDPYNPDVIFNNGHLLHQVTFFVGPVNFYWESNGKKYCSEMNTGDSNYITPFVPHSFTSRKEGEECYIIAVTFGGRISEAQDELYKIGSDKINEIAGDARSQSNLFKMRLKRYLDAESVDKDWLTNELIQKKLSNNDIEILLAGETTDSTLLGKLADILNINIKDLMVTSIDYDDEVVLSFKNKEKTREYPSNSKQAYRIKALARASRLSYVKGLDIHIQNDDAVFISHSLHEYAFNYGEHTVILNWNENEEVMLQPGDSAYIRPFISHSFKRLNHEQDGNLVIMRIPGVLTNELLDEYSCFAIKGRYRTCGENKRWF